MFETITAVVFALGFGYMVGHARGMRTAYKRAFTLSDALGGDDNADR